MSTTGDVTLCLYISCLRVSVVHKTSTLEWIKGLAGADTWQWLFIIKIIVELGTRLEVKLSTVVFGVAAIRTEERQAEEKRPFMMFNNEPF